MFSSLGFKPVIKGHFAVPFVYLAVPCAYLAVPCAYLAVFSMTPDGNLSYESVQSEAFSFLLFVFAF